MSSTVSCPASLRSSPSASTSSQRNAEKVADELGRKLRKVLESRTFEYTRSNGKKKTLSLADVIDRRKAMEMAYNPNDCAEIRWAAPEGSEEMSSCKRHAPEEQRAEMKRLRGWFESRERPFN